MKKMMMFAALAAVAGMTAGCFTKAVAYTKTTPDGSKESRVSIVGTGDKASQIAAEGLFADGAAEDLGAGVKNAKATQQSTGIKETLEGMGVLLTGIGSIVAKTQGVPTASAVVSESSVSGSSDTAPSVAYTGTPLADGSGVYGKPGCGRCAVYKANHPDAQIIDIVVESNRTAMWAALRKLGYTGDGVDLPVVITPTGFTLSAK